MDLDPVMRGHPPCIRSLVAARETVLSASDLVAMHDLYVFVPHDVHKIITNVRTMHLSNARLLTFPNILYTLQNVIIHHYTTLNPATHFNTAEDRIPHDCLMVLDIISKSCLDISDKPDYNVDCLFLLCGWV